MLFVTFMTKHLSEHDRQIICITLLALNVIQVFVAVCGFSVGAYVSLSLNSKAHLIRGYSLKPIGGTMSGCSIALFALHCLGAKAISDCIYLRTPTLRHFENKLLLIVLGYIGMSVALLGVSILCVVHYLKLKTTFHHGLLAAMKFYSKDRNLKKDLDNLQVEYRCCGSSNHTDWFKIKWMPEISLPSEKDRTFRRLDYLRSVPFSCCDASNTGPCFHREVSTERGRYKYPNHGFFKKGCTDVLLEVLQEIIQAIALLILVPFFIEVMIAVQTRYLQTSLEDCKRQQNFHGLGKCWLIRKDHHETDLQSQAFVEDLIGLSSSEDSLISNSNEIKYFDESDHISKVSPTKLKSRIRREVEEISPVVENNDEDLRKLLLKQMARNGESSGSKSENCSETQVKTTKGKSTKQERKYQRNKKERGGISNEKVSRSDRLFPD